MSIQDDFCVITTTIGEEFYSAAGLSQNQLYKIVELPVAFNYELERMAMHLGLACSKSQLRELCASGRILPEISNIDNDIYLPPSFWNYFKPTPKTYGLECHSGRSETDWMHYKLVRTKAEEAEKLIIEDAQVKKFGEGARWLDRGYFFLIYAMEQLKKSRTLTKDWTKSIKHYFAGTALEWYNENAYSWDHTVRSENQRWRNFRTKFIDQYIPECVPPILMKWFLYQPLLKSELYPFLDRVQTTYRYLQLLHIHVFRKYPDYFAKYTLPTISEVKENILKK